MLFKKEYYANGSELMWAKNNNGINFENIQPLSITYPNTINVMSLAFSDINNDGTTDILLLSYYYNNETFNYEIILLENQNGIFSATHIATLVDDYGDGSIKINDIDQDGDLDFFVYDQSEKPFLFYRNDGQNNFFKIIIDNIDIDDIEFDDNDGDGKNEIYASNYNYYLISGNVFYYTTSDFINFAKFEIDSFEITDDSVADLLLFDYNGDNKKDLFINPSSIFGSILVYMNSSNALTVEEPANNNNTLKLFPNPFTNSINWIGESHKNYNLQLFTLNGTLIHQEKTSNNSVDLSFLNTGLYLLVIEDIQLNSKRTYKIIKQ